MGVFSGSRDTAATRSLHPAERSADVTRSDLQPASDGAGPNAGAGSGLLLHASAAAPLRRPSGIIERLYASSHALVIGNDAYSGQPGWPKLGKAVSDAVAVKTALEAQGFAVTFHQNLGSNELKRAMREFFIRNGTSERSRLFVWFAGHGYTTRGEGYLVPVDAPHPDKDVEFRSMAVSMREVAGWMSEARSRHILAVFDSCFSGSIFRATRNMQGPSAAILQFAKNPIRQIITSGSARQEVQDDGYFQQLFVRAISGLEPRADQTGDGFITGQELAAYIKLQVANRNGGRQTPQYGELANNDTERGDFVFELPSGGRLPPGPALAHADTAQPRAMPASIKHAFGLSDAQRVYVAPILGAPGDGNSALYEAVKTRLGQEGIEVWNADSESAFKLRTVVEVRSLALFVDEVTIRWSLSDKTRGNVASFAHVTEVMKGARNKTWGTAADTAAEFAAKRLVKYFATN
ncbi:MAG: caspase family protein [Hyphomicrobiaceae bacterium]